MRRLLLALALTAAAPAAPAQEVGRLFFTPEQRDALDARRKARVPDKPAAAAAVASPTTRLDGYVKRSSGRSTIFVNGQPVLEGTSEAPVIDPDRRGGRVPVPVGEGSARPALKPGETLEIGSGRVRDVIGGGRIEVRRGQ
jgi:hypothetical protein